MATNRLSRNVAGIGFFSIIGDVVVVRVVCVLIMVALIIGDSGDRGEGV